MFRKKVKEDPTELELLKIRVRNLEKQVAELKKAPQVQAEELGVGMKANVTEIGTGLITGFIEGNPIMDFKNRKNVIVDRSLLID